MIQQFDCNTISQNLVDSIFSQEALIYTNLVLTRLISFEIITVLLKTSMVEKTCSSL